MTTYYSVDEYKESFDAPAGDKQPPANDDKGMSTTTIVIIVVVIVALVGIGAAVGVILMRRAKAKKIDIDNDLATTPDVQLGGKNIRSTDEVLASVEQPMTNSPVELGTSDIL